MQQLESPSSAHTKHPLTQQNANALLWNPEPLCCRDPTSQTSMMKRPLWIDCDAGVDDAQGLALQRSTGPEEAGTRLRPVHPRG